MGIKVEKKLQKIVCIDDDAWIVELLTFIVNTNGFEGIGAQSGPDGLELIANEKPDLVLLDLAMPEMDGWDVYQRMKADEQMRKVPVIVVSARAQAVDKIVGLNVAKVQDYVTKPFSPDDLVKRIHKVLDVPSSPGA